MGNYCIVWNGNRSEGIILKDKKDVTFASTGEHVHYPDSSIGVSTLADAWREIYDEDDEFDVQEVML